MAFWPYIKKRSGKMLSKIKKYRHGFIIAIYFVVYLILLDIWNSGLYVPTMLYILFLMI